MPGILEQQEITESEKDIEIIGVGVSEAQGFRAEMEDASSVEKEFGGEINGNKKKSLFGVYDGHWGPEAAQFAKLNISKNLIAALAKEVGVEEAIFSCFLETDRQIEDTGTQSGCTVALAYIEGGELYVANVGDAGVLIVSEKDNIVRKLTHTHNPEDAEETERIKKAGGTIEQGGIHKGGIVINTARALGDKSFGDLVSPEPYVKQVKLEAGDYRLVLATDGLFNAISEQEVADGIKDFKDPNKAARQLTFLAINEDNSDNVTAIIVDLKVN